MAKNEDLDSVEYIDFTKGSRVYGRVQSDPKKTLAGQDKSHSNEYLVNNYRGLDNRLAGPNQSKTKEIERNYPGQFKVLKKGENYLMANIPIGTNDFSQSVFQNGLDQIADKYKLLKLQGQQPSIDITGLASSSVLPGKGSEIYASNRANELKKQLIKRGIPSTSIRQDILFGPEPDPRSISSEQKALNRGAVIKFENQILGSSSKENIIPISWPMVKDKNEYGDFYFSTIEERHIYYKFIDTKYARKRDVFWFRAADLVTDEYAIGAIDRTSRAIISLETEIFLRKGNQYVSKFNVEDFARNIIYGKEIPGAEGLKGKQLDYKMVEIEQEHIENFIRVYRKNFLKTHPYEEWNNILHEINKGFNDLNLIDIIKNFDHRNAIISGLINFKKQYGRSAQFDFALKQHRIFLGQGIIDYLRTQYPNR